MENVIDRVILTPAAVDLWRAMARIFAATLHRQGVRITAPGREQAFALEGGCLCLVCQADDYVLQLTLGPEHWAWNN